MAECVHSVSVIDLQNRAHLRGAYHSQLARHSHLESVRYATRTFERGEYLLQNYLYSCVRLLHAESKTKAN